jgi:transmembrane sensor
MNEPGSSQNSAAGASPDWEAIARYLANESPAEETARVRAWLDANPGDRKLIESLDETARVSVADIDVEAALRRVHQRMENPAPRLGVIRGSAPRWRRAVVIPSLLAAAAVVAIVVVRRAPQQVIHYDVPVAREYATAVGQRDSVLLSDGSRVILGPASRLEVGATYGTDTRSVVLHGDAYFDVRHDAAKPFSVRVGDAIVEDIGTTFTIESDAGDTTSVSVMTGSVRLRPTRSSANAGAILSAGDRGAMSVNGQVRTYPHSVTDDAAAWTSGRLVFRDASLARVTGELKRWYGVTLHVADSSLATQHVNATFTDEPVDQVLKVIGSVLGARIERQGDNATVTSNRGSTTKR